MLTSAFEASSRSDVILTSTRSISQIDIKTYVTYVRHGQTDRDSPSEAVQDSIRSPAERVRMEKEDTRNE